MPQLTGIRADGHRIITTVTGSRGTMTVTRQHHPECPCTEERPMPDQPTVWPTFTLQRWEWTGRAWETHAVYESERGEGNAYDAVDGEHASQTGPIRLLRDGVEVLADDPDIFYSNPA